jgi:hypothetical protein
MQEGRFFHGYYDCYCYRTGRPARRFKEWTTLNSWSRRRRVGAKAEWTRVDCVDHAPGLSASEPRDSTIT